MLITSDISLYFGSRKLFENVNLKFNPGNCYGVIGANGAGKSTFLKILARELEPSKGEVHIPENMRLSVLKQNHFQYEEEQVLQTVLMGNAKLLDVIREKDALYAKADFTEADGIRAAELEAEFTSLRGWEAETDAAILLKGLGLGEVYLQKYVKELTPNEKVKVLLAQALFGNPDVLLLDEPTNHLDAASIRWLEGFILDFPNTVIVVSHDRHFLNMVCTHMVDIDYGKINLYVGNYDFWLQSSQLSAQLRANENRKKEDKIKDLQNFVQRFSANASKSKQATSRKKQLEKITLEDIPISSRKRPYLHFEQAREAGDLLLEVKNLSKTVNGEKVLNDISFMILKGEKVAFLGENEIAKTTLMEILMGRCEADSGEIKWGVTTSRSFLPKDSTDFFAGKLVNLLDWLADFSEDKSNQFLRSFLGRLLFSGEETLKMSNVLSGGEKVRCMLARMMLQKANVLLLDGPTSHLDLETITALNDGLIAFKGTILFTSHDQEFVQTLGNRLIELTPGGGLVDYKMSYNDYLNLTAASNSK